MENTSEITSGLYIPSQIPLDAKAYVASEALLSSLGPSNILAFAYFKGITVKCQQEGTTWEWREVKAGEENTGLIPNDFTYPDNIIVNGIDYSNKTYNFFVESRKGDKGDQGIQGPAGPMGPQGERALSNLQKIEYTSFVLDDSYNDHTVIIKNETSNITIEVPSGLMENISVGFLKKGTGKVSFIKNGTTIETTEPNTLTIKGILLPVYIEQEGISNTYNLMGNLIT